MIQLAVLASIIVGGFCLVTIGVSHFITFLYSKRDNQFVENSHYECGFVNKENIVFWDNKLHIIPLFLVLEAIMMYMVFYIFCRNQSTLWSLGLYMLLIGFTVCAKHLQRQ